MCILKPQFQIIQIMLGTSQNLRDNFTTQRLLTEWNNYGAPAFKDTGAKVLPGREIFGR